METKSKSTPQPERTTQTQDQTAGLPSKNYKMKSGKGRINVEPGKPKPVIDF